MASAPLIWPARPRRSAAERRLQALRAQGRMVQKLLASFEALSSHRGCRTSRLGSALSAALRKPADLAQRTPSVSPCPSAASSQPAAALVAPAPPLPLEFGDLVVITGSPCAKAVGKLITLSRAFAFVTLSDGTPLPMVARKFLAFSS